MSDNSSMVPWHNPDETNILLQTQAMNFIFALDSLSKKDRAYHRLERISLNIKYVNSLNALKTAWLGGRTLICGLRIPYEIIVMIANMVVSNTETFELGFYGPLSYSKPVKRASISYSFDKPVLKSDLQMLKNEMLTFE